MNAGYLRVAVALGIVALVAGGYAESFPNRPVAEDMNEYVAQGIICGNAVRERELAVNRSQSFLPYCGVWQPYIVSLQQELETLAPLYIDHDNGPLTDAGDAFLYFTLDNWRAAAGLNASGFRRSTDGTTFYYGQMQSGDIIGPWIFEDLQKGSSVLEYTLKTGTLGGMRKTGGVNGGDHEEHRGDLAWMKSAAEGLYAACSPFSSSTFEVGSYIFRFQDAWYDCLLHRTRGDLAVTGVPEITDVTHTWQLYLIAANLNWHPNYSTGSDIVFDTFGDFTYSPADGVLSKIEEDDTPSSDNSHEVAFGSLTQPPWCSNPAVGIASCRGYSAGNLSFLLKWSFTDQNP